MRDTQNYEAWKIEKEEFPSNGSMEDKIKFFVRYGILAPSTHNSQPWKFRLYTNTLEILPEWNYKLPYGDPENRYLYFSLGCCVTNIIHAAMYFGYKTEISLNKTKDIPIQLKFSKVKKKSLINNFFFITKRFTDKFFYDKKPLDNSILSKLRSIELPLGFDLKIITDEDLLFKISELHKQAILSFLKNKPFKDELSGWMRTNNTLKPDGMPGFISGMSSLKVTVGKILLRNTPIVIKGHAKKDSMLILNSPGVGAILSKTNTIKDWIKAGMLYEETALNAKSENLNLAILTAMLEDTSSKNKLKDLLKTKSHIQIFFRIGSSGKENLHTPRREPQYVN